MNRRPMTCSLYRGILFGLLLGIFSSAAWSQSAPTWTGSVSCQVDDEEQGAYQRQEIQTWTLTGAPPTFIGAMPIYPATWAAQAQGQLLRTQGTQTMSVQWVANVPMPGGQTVAGNLVIYIRASDNRLVIGQWHTLMSAANALNGQRQIFANGVPQGQPAPFSRALQEWKFPPIEVSPTDTTVTGSGQGPADAGVAETVHHFGGMPPTATCQWKLSKGGSAQNTTGPTMGNQTSNQGQQNSYGGNSGTQNGNPNTMGGGTQNSTPPSSQTGNGNPSLPANSNCDSPGAVQQSFESMKTNIKSSYDTLIQGTTDQAQIASLQQQEQRTLTSLSTQEQHDMQTAAANGCTGAGHAGSAQNTTNPTTNSNSNGGQISMGTPVSNPTGSGQNATGTTGQGNQTGSGSSSMPVSLTTSSNGVGSGSVAMTPVGASCGANCMQYAQGTSVTVVAIPNTGSTFTNFSGGACGSTNPCSFSLTAPTTVTATFSLNNSSSGSMTSTSSSTGSNTGLQVGTPNHTITSMAMLTGVSPTTNNGQSSVTVKLTGQLTHFATGSTKVSFARSATQPQATSMSMPANAALQSLQAGKTSAPALQAGQVQALTGTSLSIPVTMNPATAAGSYDITVTTPISTGTETVTLKSVFTVTNTPAITGVNITPTTTKNIGSSTTPAATSAQYRAVITGLMCMHHISSGDAIYAAAVVRQYDRRNNQNTMFTNMNTWVYGDVNGMQGQRKQAGTRGPGGGMGDGDLAPTGFMPGTRDTMPTPQVNNLLPLTLWEGTLTDGVDALVISPSLWINYGDNPFFSTWNQNEDSFTNSIFTDSRIQNQINTQTLGPLVLGSSQTVGGSFAQSYAGDVAQAVIDTVLVIPFVELQGNPSHDRPIGVADASATDPTSSMILPNTTLVLTREMIEKRLGSGSWMMMPLDFNDTAHGFTGLIGSDRPGEYQMFIQIERTSGGGNNTAPAGGAANNPGTVGTNSSGGR